MSRICSCRHIFIYHVRECSEQAADDYYLASYVAIFMVIVRSESREVDDGME